MQNTAVYAPITFEEIVMIVINYIIHIHCVLSFLNCMLCQIIDPLSQITVLSFHLINELKRRVKLFGE